jgi:hypothetical protein
VSLCLAFIKFRLLLGGVKQDVRNLTNWQQRRQSNLHSRIRALNGAAYCVGSLKVPSPGCKRPGGGRTGAAESQRLTWARRHKIDVNEEYKQ